jgi:hypothetical protein
VSLRQWPKVQEMLFGQMIRSDVPLVQIKIFTAEPQRSQRKNLLFGEEITPNKKDFTIEEKAHDKCWSHQAPDFNPEGMQSLIQSQSPDWIREKHSSAISASLR